MLWYSTIETVGSPAYSVYAKQLYAPPYAGKRKFTHPFKIQIRKQGVLDCIWGVSCFSVKDEYATEKLKMNEWYEDDNALCLSSSFLYRTDYEISISSYAWFSWNKKPIFHTCKCSPCAVWLNAIPCEPYRMYSAVNTTVKFMLLWKKTFPRWIVPVWKANATSCDCLCLSRSEISFCLCFKVYISVLYRFSFFHRSVFLQKKRCEALSAFFYFISFPLPL